MEKKLGNWFKGHRALRVLLPGAITLLLVLALVVPYYAMGGLEYVDVEGTYTITSTIMTKYLDGSRHPAISCDTLVITTQTDQAIEAATLTMPGKTVSLTGLVGAGSRPYISLTGNDAVGSYVTINGKVTQKAGVATQIKGKIEGFITSDGYKVVYGGNGTAAHSTVAYHSGAYSALITAGSEGGSVGIQFNRPLNKIKLKDLDTLTAGKLGFWFNFQDTKTPGPFIGLRFAAPGQNSMNLFAPAAGHVDVTIMPYQDLTGDGTWKECQLTADTISAIYYGNAPDEGATSFGYAVGGKKLSEMEAMINAETAMEDYSASNWELTMVLVVLYEAGARTCYVDNVRIGKYTYTLEPTMFSGSIRAKK